MADVFISSAKADRDFVWQLASYLRSQARTVWWDADNRGRDYVAGTVERELESAHKVIVLWTRASITSPFILHEAIAAHDAGKLVQVKASDVQVSNLPRALRGLRILDATDFTAITRAVSVQEDSATELPVAAMLSKRSKLRHVDDDGSVISAVGRAAITRPPMPNVDTPSIQASRPGRADRTMGGPVHPSMKAPSQAALRDGSAPVRARKSVAGRIVVASVLASFVGVVVAMKYGLLEGVSSVLTKILALLSLNMVPPVGAAPAQSQTEIVDCSVFAPPSAPPGRSVFVQVFLHAAEQFERAETIASKIDQAAYLRGISTLQTEVTRGQRLSVTLDCLELAPDVASREVVWRGHPQAVSFRVTIPNDAPHGRDFFPIVRVSIEGVPVGFVEFAIGCRDGTIREADGTGDAARRYKYAFLSHASQDRKEVMKFARALSAAKIGFFQDILSLEPGDEWEERLFQEIDRCDVFYLFWSKHAANSAMVRREAEHAHKRSTLTLSKAPSITPIRLDASPLPTDPPHPPWMMKIHFDDAFRKLIEAETSS